LIERRLDPLEHAWRLLVPSPERVSATEVPRRSSEIAVFDDDSGPLVPDPPGSAPAGAPYRTAPAVGAAELVVYTDDGASLVDLGRDRIELLIHVWADRYAELGARPDVAYVFIFENRGAEFGVTLDHPHGQIYAYPYITPRTTRLLRTASTALVPNNSVRRWDAALPRSQSE